MKKFNRFTFIFTLSVLICFTVISAGAVTRGISDFGVSFNRGESQLKVQWWQKGVDYYLFLPSDASLNELTLDYTASSDVTLDGESIAAGETVAFENKGRYVLSCEDKEYNLVVLKSENIPSLHITTESGSMDAVHADKSHKEPANALVVSEGEVVIDQALDYIKGRGNATWNSIKKPYNIKFDKKTSVLGMDKAKKWTLLANYGDKTLMHNATAFDFADAVGLEFTSQHKFVDLYIDNEYYGNYLICESVEVGSGRVDIEDLEGATEDVNEEDLDSYPLSSGRAANYKQLKPGSKHWVDIPNNPENITGGYLLEYELANRYPAEASGFVTDKNQTIVLKAPEYATKAQVEYISAYYQEFEDAIYSPDGYNSLGKHYSEYIDVDSFVKMYVFQEFVKNFDAGLTSFYIYKDADSDKFVAAPVWDFDNALGTGFERFGTNSSYPDGWFAGVIYYLEVYAIKDTLPTVLNILYRHKDFFSLACEEWQNEFSPRITDEYIKSITDRYESISASAVMNAIRWSYYDSDEYESVSDKYEDTVQNTLIGFIEKRKAFLDKGFSDTNARVFYNGNGAKGNMINFGALQLGDKLTVPASEFTRTDYNFVAWNTKADGTGKSYKTGDVITLDSEELTLYAQWEKKPAEVKPEPEEEPKKEPCNHLCHSKSAFTQFFWKIFRGLFKLFGTNKICKCGVAHY